MLALAEPAAARSTRWPAPLVLACALAVFAAHALAYRDWIIDDAGISFAYARSLAQGHGLIAQPGAEPVEGYSNFTWTVLLAGFFRLGWFDPTVTPKLLACVLVAASFALLLTHWPPARDAHGRVRWAPALALVLTAANPAFVIWTTSGLENPLSVLLFVTLLVLCLRTASDLGREGTPVGRAGVAGLVAGALALTRPDGILAVLALPASLLAVFGAGLRRGRVAAVAATVLAFAATAIAVTGAFLLFRHAYYGEWLPNTYYAKAPASWLPALRTLAATASIIGLGVFAVRARGWLLAAAMLGVGTLIATSRVASLMRAVLSGAGSLLLFGAVAALVVLARRQKLAPDLRVLTAVTAVAGLPYLLLPPDWMGEFRFATPFLPLVHLLLAEAGARSLAVVPARTATARAVLLVLLLGWIGSTLALDGRRMQRFAMAPAVPFAAIADRYARRHARYCAILARPDTSIMDVDIGGLLYASTQRVYDLGSLCDRTIARTLGRDRAALHDYVFATVKPTLLNVHGEASVLAQFDADPRFRRDYVPIHEQPGLLAPGAGAPVHDGFYVRRDALRDDSVLPALRAVAG